MVFGAYVDNISGVSGGKLGWVSEKCLKVPGVFGSILQQLKIFGE